MAENSYNNILVPYDNSKFSQKALQTAMMLAEAYRSTLYLVTVIDASNVMPPGLIRTEESKKTFSQIKASIRHSAETILEQKEQECKDRGIRTFTFITEGLVADELLKFGKRSSIDLVVIGSQGLSGFSRLKALGSVSRRLAEFADCPVIIMH